MRKTRQSRVDVAEHDQNGLHLESLESRLLLSGNIQASVDNGTLSIIGDDADNAALVSTFYDSTYGTGFRVEGFDYGGPTTVNGGAYAEFFGVSNLNVDLNGGNNDFAVTNDIESLSDCVDVIIEPTPELLADVSTVHIPGWANIRMGDGFNRVGVGPATVGGRLLVEGGSSQDQIGLCDVDVYTHMVMRTFGGDDRVLIHDSSSAGLTRVLTANGDSEVIVDGLHASDLVVKGGYHQDQVSAGCLWIEDDVVIQTFNGYDWVEVGGCYRDEPNGEEPPVLNGNHQRSEIGDILAIQTFDGGAYVDVYKVDAGRINVLGGLHDDHVEIYKSYTVYNMNVSTLGGDDSVVANRVNALNMFVNTGNGDDEVFVGGNSYGESYFRDDLVIITGNGDDLVRLGLQQYPSGALQFTDDETYNIADDLVINTGDGTDLIDISYYDVGGNAIIDAGAGDDQGSGYDDWGGDSAQPYSQGGVLIYDMHINGHLNVYLGTGDDLADIEYVDVGGNATIDAGPGNDRGYGYDEQQLASAAPGYGSDGGVYLYDMYIDGHLNVFLGSGDDSADIEYLYVGGNAYIDAGTGDDGGSIATAGAESLANGQLNIGDMYVGQSFWLVLGTGLDAAYVSYLDVGQNAYFNAGADDDQLALYSVDVYNNLYVFMGGGDDSLYIDSSSATNAWLHGNGGSGDSYYDGGNSFGVENIYTFEYLVS